MMMMMIIIIIIIIIITLPSPTFKVTVHTKLRRTGTDPVSAT
jgi:hypothetical protein